MDNKDEKNVSVSDERLDELLSSLKLSSPDISSKVIKEIKKERRLRTIRRISAVSAAAVLVICAVPIIKNAVSNSAPKSSEPQYAVYDAAVTGEAEESIEAKESTEEVLEVLTEPIEMPEEMESKSESFADSFKNNAVTEGAGADTFSADDAYTDEISEIKAKEVPLAGIPSEDYVSETEEESAVITEAPEVPEESAFSRFFRKIAEFFKKLFHIM